MLTIGLCGGFTTFSTFSNESLQLLKSGLYPSFFTYIIGSVVLGISSNARDMDERIKAKYPSGSIPHRTGGIEIAPQLLNLILISRHFVRL